MIDAIEANMNRTYSQRDMDWAQVAKLFEGEGCFNLGVIFRDAPVQLEIKMSDRDQIEFVKKISGSPNKIYVVKPKISKITGKLGKVCYRLNITGKRNVLNACENMRPYLGSRRTQECNKVISYIYNSPQEF